MLYSIGIAELKSIAKGVEACDEALKSAGVNIVAAQPSCPGKYEIILTGEISDVQVALDRIKANYGKYVIDAVRLGRVDQRVVKALMGAPAQASQGSLGIIETFSGASAIQAADAAIKAASVEIMDLRISRGMGGKGFVMLTGHVGDVTAAVEAGSRYAKDQGLLTGTSVIAAPHEELWRYL